MSQKTVVAIHDIACHGRCSLTIALPLLSAAGLQTSVIPTAVLSTHTGGFGAPVITDLSESIKQTLSHFNSQGVDFDCIYSGYLTSEKQINILIEHLNLIRKKNTLFIADPVMGDNGKLYNSFTPEFAEKMTVLCSTADIIIPNITEACLMTDIRYAGENLDKKRALLILNRLYEKTGSEIVLTGIDCGEKIANAIFDGKTAEYIYNEKVSASYHGTGDIFASVFTAAVLRGFNLFDSVKIAGDYAQHSLKDTLISGKKERNGVEFETSIPHLLKLLGIN